MSNILFFAILALCCGSVIWALWRPERFYVYPVLCALTIGGYILPQFLVLIDYPELPDGALALTGLMVLLSFVAIVFGWRSARRSEAAGPQRQFNENRLLIGAVALSLFGAYFRMAIRGLPAELLEMSQWSGPQTIYLFLAGTQTLALAIGWLLFLRTGRYVALGIAIFNLLFFLDAMVIGGRRTVIVEVSFIVLAGLWLTRRWVPPRAALLAGALGAAILFSVIGEYRTATNAGQVHTNRISIAEAWQNVKQIDFMGTLTRLPQTPPHMLDLYNATLIIGGTQEQQDFVFFAVYWNRIVNVTIPGQVLGFDFKRSLMFAVSDPASDVYGAARHTGTTATGFADSFQAFWFFGAFIFFAFAWMMRKFYEKAIHGDLLNQFLYLVFMTDALLSITHGTGWFVATWPFVAVFTIPVFWLAHQRHDLQETVPDSEKGAWRASGGSWLNAPP